MPEVVEVAELRKEPYDAQDGDLATAGAVNFRRTGFSSPGLSAAERLCEIHGSLGSERAGGGLTATYASWLNQVGLWFGKIECGPGD